MNTQLLPSLSQTGSTFIQLSSSRTGTAVMYCRAHFLVVLPALQLATANPIAFPQGGSNSCPSEDLKEATWKKLDLDGFLAGAAPNLTTNDVQGFASSLGAPNFFW